MVMKARWLSTRFLIDNFYPVLLIGVGGGINFWSVSAYQERQLINFVHGVRCIKKVFTNLVAHASTGILSLVSVV